MAEKAHNETNQTKIALAQTSTKLQAITDRYELLLKSTEAQRNGMCYQKISNSKTFFLFPAKYRIGRFESQVNSEIFSTDKNKFLKIDFIATDKTKTA